MKISELLSRKEKWVQGDDAVSKTGKSVDARSRSAVCWCLNGAAMRCYPPKLRGMIFDKLETTIKKMHPRSFGILNFNDTKGRLFRDVKKVVKAAGV